MTATRLSPLHPPTVIPASDGSLTLSIPIQLQRRGGRKQIRLPDHSSGEAALPRTPTSLQRALARAHRWLALLTSGQVKSLQAIARQAGVDRSYVSRIIHLTTLAPDIVAAILEDTLPDHITLLDLAINPPLLWDAQRRRLQRILQALPSEVDHLRAPSFTP